MNLFSKDMQQESDRSDKKPEIEMLEKIYLCNQSDLRYEMTWV